MKLKFIAICVFFYTSAITAQTKKPKLVVGIVVDQMRYDFLIKFYDNFGEGGFKKLMKDGFSCNSLNYNYKPTYTGPGHASIFTGTSPSVHGIVANHWFDRSTQESIYCVTLIDSMGKSYKSPERLLSETFADGIKQFTNFESKSFGISLKDRGAILPAGHLADGAYWFNSENGEWESSDYYSRSNALEEFNSNDFSAYLETGWKLSLPLNKYSISLPDANNFEYALSKSTEPVFPYNLIDIQKEIGWGILKKIPQGNDMTADAAKFLIKNESIGKDNITDFISVSFSATDYVGHRFGVQSLEVHDTYVKLDKTIADFIQFLNNEVGEGEYTLFLTSDHGAGMPRAYLKEKKLPNGYLNERELRKGLENEIELKTGNSDWVSKLMNLNVYFNDSLKQNNPKLYAEVKFLAHNWLSLQDGIASVLDAENIEYPVNVFQERAIRGIKPYSSGDLICVEAPNWSPYTEKGSTHGSGYGYDTHVPLLFYGLNVPKGKTNENYSITSIVATLSRLTGIPFANSNDATVIKEIFE